MVAKPNAKHENLPVEVPKSSAVIVPDFMKDQAGQGTEDLSSADVEIPRIKLLQAISPELTEYEDVKQAEFFHTVAEVSVGDELTIVPLYIWQSYMLWNPRESGGGILARADDGVHWNPPNGEHTVKINKGTKTVTWKLAPTVAASRLDQWGSYDPDNANSQPAATRMYNIVAYLPDHPDLSPVVITLQRSGIKPARRFLGKLKITRAPSYGQRFVMSSTQDTNSNGDKFWNYKLTGAGFVTDQDEFESYKALYEQFKESGARIRDIEGLADEDVAVGSADVDVNNKDF